MRKIPWTEQEADILKRMAENNKTLNEMLVVLRSRSIGSIRNKMQDLGIGMKQPQPEIDIDEFKRIMKGAK